MVIDEIVSGVYIISTTYNKESNGCTLHGFMPGLVMARLLLTLDELWMDFLLKSRYS